MKDTKGQLISKAIYRILNSPKNERNALRILSSALRLFFGRIEETIICFRDLLTLTHMENKKHLVFISCFLNSIYKIRLGHNLSQNATNLL